MPGRALTEFALSTGHTNAEINYPTSTREALQPAERPGVSMLKLAVQRPGSPAAYPDVGLGLLLLQGLQLKLMVLSGLTNGEADANGIWHNGQYQYYSTGLDESCRAGTGGARVVRTSCSAQRG